MLGLREERVNGTVVACDDSTARKPQPELCRRTQRTQFFFHCFVVSPDYVGRFLTDRLDPATTKYVLTLRIEAVSPADDGSGVVYETSSGFPIQKRANHRPRRGF